MSGHAAGESDRPSRQMSVCKPQAQVFDLPSLITITSSSQTVSVFPGFLTRPVARLKFLPSSSVIFLSDYAFAVSDDVGFLTTR